MDFAENIKKIREGKGLSQHDLAKKLDVYVIFGMIESSMLSHREIILVFCEKNKLDRTLVSRRAIPF